MFSFKLEKLNEKHEEVKGNKIQVEYFEYGFSVTVVEYKDLNN